MTSCCVLYYKIFISYKIVCSIHQEWKHINNKITKIWMIQIQTLHLYKCTSNDLYINFWIENFEFLAKSLFYILFIEIWKLNLKKKVHIICLLAKTYVHNVDIVCIVQCINNLNLLFLQNLALIVHSRIEKKIPSKIYTTLVLKTRNKSAK